MAVSQPHFEQEQEHSEPTVELLPTLDGRLRMLVLLLELGL